MIDPNKPIQVQYEGNVEWRPAWFVGVDMQGRIVTQINKNGILYCFSKDGSLAGCRHKLRNTPPTKTKLFFFTVRNAESGLIASYVSTLSTGSAGYKCLPEKWETIDRYEREIEL